MIRSIINMVAFLLVVLVNTLANLIPFNGQTTGEISNKLNVLFTPAGYVFSIWGLIYFLLFIWVIRQFPVHRRHLEVYQKTTPLFLLSCLLNCGWIFLWHYNYFTYTVMVMIGLLVTLSLLYKRVKLIKPPLIDRLTFSVYLGWISVATVANISYWLVYIDWQKWGISDGVWAVSILLATFLLAVFFRIRENDSAYALVFVWSYIGIGIKNHESFPMLSLFTYSLAIGLVLIVIFGNKQRLKGIGLHW